MSCVRIVAWLVFAKLLASSQLVVASSLTVADSLEVPRLVGLGVDPITLASTPPVLTSPDGTRYVVFVSQGDLSQGGYWLEILQGSLHSTKTAVPSRVTRLFTDASRDDRIGRMSPLSGHYNQVVWLDNDKIAFLWATGREATQLTIVDLMKGQVIPRTNSSTSVLRYAISRDGNSVVYYAFPRLTVKPELDRELAVTHVDAFEFARQYDEGNPWHRLELYVQTATDIEPRQVIGSVAGPYTRGPTHFSPDGRFALVTRKPIDALPRHWGALWDLDMKVAFEKFVQIDPDLSRDYGSGVDQAFLIDVERALITPLMDAPLPIASLGEPSFVWSKDSSRVAIGPTYVPADRSAETPEARYTVIVSIAEGTVDVLALPSTDAKLRPVTWTDRNTLWLSNGVQTLEYSLTGNRWKWVQGLAASNQQRSNIRIEVRQNLNDPPTLYAIDSSSSERLLLDPAPQLKASIELGNVEMFEWQDSSNRRWTGRLYYPTSFKQGRRYPLVIQTHGHAPSTTFSLEGVSPANQYAAQVLTGRGMFVLQVQNRSENQVTPNEAEMYSLAYESAIAKLASINLVDPTRVGLSGYSRSGWHVAHALVHSDFRYCAAVVSDNIDGSYLQSVLIGGLLASEYVQTIGDKPLGNGFERWLERSVGFNADRVVTPLRIEAMTSGRIRGIASWELFSNLRSASRPVELVVAPYTEFADHPFQMIQQKYSSQQGAVDWFDFWLNDREDSNTEKHDQYGRWRVLRLQQQEVDKKERRPLLDWKASPAVTR